MGNYVFFGLSLLSSRFLDGELKRYGNATHGKASGNSRSCNRNSIYIHFGDLWYRCWAKLPEDNSPTDHRILRA